MNLLLKNILFKDSERVSGLTKNRSIDFICNGDPELLIYRFQVNFCATMSEIIDRLQLIQFKLENSQFHYSRRELLQDLIDFDTSLKNSYMTIFDDSIPKIIKSDQYFMLLHDFNNFIVGYTLNFTFLIKIISESRRISSDDRELIVAKVRRGIEHGKKSLEDLFVQWNVGYKTKKVYLDEVVVNVVEQADILLKSRGVQLSQHPGVNESIQISPLVIHRILFNLIKNSTEAFPKKYPRSKKIHLEWGIDSFGIDLTVTDNGLGIPAQQLERITQTAYTTKAKDKNMMLKARGYGLASVSQLVSENGGKLIITSHYAGTENPLSEQSGTVAQVKLPAA